MILASKKWIPVEILYISFPWYIGRYHWILFYFWRNQQIGKAFLPSISISTSLPAPAETSATITESSVAKTEVAPEDDSVPTPIADSNSAPLKAEADAVSSPEVDTVPAPEVAAAAAVPNPSRPLSPFPYVKFL